MDDNAKTFYLFIPMTFVMSPGHLNYTNKTYWEGVRNYTDSINSKVVTKDNSNKNRWYSQGKKQTTQTALILRLLRRMDPIKTDGILKVRNKIHRQR